jgi:hypothetical protein
LEIELHEFKNKWAESQCDLQDTEQKLVQTVAEREKAVVCLKDALEALNAERMKVIGLENQAAESYVSASNNDASKNVSP